jgi:hypothetical protein
MGSYRLSWNGGIGMRESDFVAPDTAAELRFPDNWGASRHRDARNGRRLRL